MASQPPMTAARRRAMGRGNLLAQNFLKRLDAGLLADRTRAHAGHKKVPVTAVPDCLRKLARRSDGA
ncbi:MAG: hypothetical protein ACRCTG_11025 [Aestuariivirga sp.]